MEQQTAPVTQFPQLQNEFNILCVQPMSQGVSVPLPIRAITGLMSPSTASCCPEGCDGDCAKGSLEGQSRVST